MEAGGKRRKGPQRHQVRYESVSTRGKVRTPTRSRSRDEGEKGISKSLSIRRGTSMRDDGVIPDGCGSTYKTVSDEKSVRKSTLMKKP